MTKKVKWGIVGAANIARQQMIPAIMKSNKGVVHAIASKSGKARKFTDEFRIPNLYDTYEELIQDKEIDAVYIALPNSFHREWIAKAIDAGKHVLCEKPIVLEVSELAKLFERANKQKVHVMEAFMYRFHPQINEVKRMLSTGIIGDLLTMRSRFHFTVADKENDIRMNRELGGGVLWDIGCYSLNAMLALLDEEPTSISVMNGKFDRVDTHISMQFQFSNSVLGQVDCSFYGPMTQEIDLIGTEGKIRLPYAFRPDLNEHKGVIEVHKNEKVQRFEFVGESYVFQVNAFQEVIRGDISLPYTQKQMLQHTKILQLCVEQSRTS